MERAGWKRGVGEDIMPVIEQGDILKVEKLNSPVLVVSKNFFNQSEEAIVCPIIKSAGLDPLHICIKAEDISGFVLCEQMRLLDLRVREFKKTGRIKYADIINITDAIQGIFDY
jgi:mRNA-degrading endonuclease toxin of MazEF toxin-antitoxin module